VHSAMMRCGQFYDICDGTACYIN